MFLDHSLFLYLLIFIFFNLVMYRLYGIICIIQHQRNLLIVNQQSTSMMVSSTIKKQHVHAVVRSFIEQHVVNQVPEISVSAPTSNELTCRFCGRRYIQVPALRKHEEKKRQFKLAKVRNDDDHSPDKVYNYTHQVLVLMLLRLNHNDAINFGDGERIIRLYKFFCSYFKVSNCPKYAIATLQLLVDMEPFCQQPRQGGY